MNVLLARNPWTENIRHTRKASPVCTTKEFLPTTGLGSGPGTGTDACLVSAISNTEITSRLVYIFLQSHWTLEVRSNNTERAKWRQNLLFSILFGQKARNYLEFNSCKARLQTMEKRLFFKHWRIKTTRNPEDCK